jgi:hypothetical protein
MSALAVCSNVIASSRVENLFHLTGKTIARTLPTRRAAPASSSLSNVTTAHL